MCIYYQDEFAFCCINGIDMQDFSKNKRCVEDDGYGCKLKITIGAARDMKNKLEALLEEIHFLQSTQIPEDITKKDILKRFKELLGDE